MPGVNPPFLRFHPTLALVLWERLDAAEQERLTERFREVHAQLAGLLYDTWAKNAHAARAIARLALPNLLAAVHAALDLGAPTRWTSPT